MNVRWYTPSVFSAYLSPANFTVKVSTKWSPVQAGILPLS
jgi:hypothetical protein